MNVATGTPEASEPGRSIRCRSVGESRNCGAVQADNVVQVGREIECRVVGSHRNGFHAGKNPLNSATVSKTVAPINPLTIRLFSGFWCLFVLSGAFAEILNCDAGSLDFTALQRF